MAASKYWKLKNQAARIIATGGTRWEAAKACGIDPATVFRWMKKPDFQAAVEAARPGADPEPVPDEPKRKLVAIPPAVRNALAARDNRIQTLNPDWPSDWRRDPRWILYAEMQAGSDKVRRGLWAEWLQAIMTSSHAQQ